MEDPIVSTETRQAIESILMVADQPVDPSVLAQLLEVPRASIEAACASLAEEYEQAGRGFILAQVAGGYRFQSHPDLAPYVERFVLDGQSSRLSAAALETLAIIAYKQPISRVQIAAIRGVNVDGVLRTLQQRGYVDEVSRDPGPGNAVLFGTTPLFLERVGLNELDDLPALADFVPGADVVEALEEGLRPDPLPEVEPSGGASAGDGAADDDDTEGADAGPVDPEANEGDGTGSHDSSAADDPSGETLADGSETDESDGDRSDGDPAEADAGTETEVAADGSEPVGEDADASAGTGVDDADIEAAVTAANATELVESDTDARADTGADDGSVVDNEPVVDNDSATAPLDIDAVETAVVEEIVIDLTVEPELDPDSDHDPGSAPEPVGAVESSQPTTSGTESAMAAPPAPAPAPMPDPPRTTTPLAHGDTTAVLRHDPADSAEPTVPFRPTPGDGGAAGPVAPSLAMDQAADPLQGPSAQTPVSQPGATDTTAAATPPDTGA